MKRVRYFTAPVKPLPTDPGQPARQAAYLEAIESLPSVSVHKGQFKVNPKPMPLEAPPHRVVRVLHTEEKGSDVNLATYLLLDAFREDAEVALVISDDFDLIEPLKRARGDLGRTLGVASPRRRPALARAASAAFYRPIRPEVMPAHQLPNPVYGPSGPIHRPREWA